MITKVTVTGADDKTNQDDLIALAEKYPFVEFGILLSASQEGNKRFPTQGWIEKLCNSSIQKNVVLNCSGHLCGRWVKELLLANLSEVGVMFDKYEAFFQRFQINTHGIKHKYSNWFLKAILTEFEFADKEIIFQYDDANTELVNKANSTEYCFTNISALFDLSHGAGVLPKDWPKPLDGMEVGYAGGLSPENVVEQIEKILPLVGKRDFWIDAETKLRSDVDDTFDLGKVEAFLKAAKPYTI